MYKRAEYQKIKSRLEEERTFIQVVMGARQIGKSTVVKQVLKDLSLPYQFYSADNWENTNGLEKFRQMFNPKASFIVGDGGIGVEEFLSMDISKLF